MSMFRTRSDLILEALDKLGVIAADQTPSTEDTTRVDEVLDDILHEQAALEICDVPDENNIPSAWFLSLASIVAYECREKFGIVDADAAALREKRDGAITKLKIMNRGRATYEPLKVLYF